MNTVEPPDHSLPGTTSSILLKGRLMTILDKTQALGVIRRAYGPDMAESLESRLPERIDLEDPADHELLFRLGLTRERLFDALGAEW